MRNTSRSFDLVPAPRAALRRAGRTRGFTLVESLLSVVIVSGVLVAGLGTLGAIGKTREKQVQRSAGTHLAEQVVAEVVQCRFSETTGSTSLGPEAGESTRSSFDDVDDYEGWTMSPPTLRDGTAMAGYEAWKVKVRVHHADLANPKAVDNSPSGLKRIRVIVTGPGGTEVELFALRAANGAYEQAPTSTVTALTWAGVSARVGERGKTIHGGAHPLNATAGQ